MPIVEVINVLSIGKNATDFIFQLTLQKKIDYFYTFIKVFI